MKNAMLKKILQNARKNCRLSTDTGTLGNLPGFDFQVYALLFLQVSDHRKQVARLEITFSPEHTHETLAPGY